MLKSNRIAMLAIFTTAFASQTTYAVYNVASGVVAIAGNGLDLALHFSAKRDTGDGRKPSTSSSVGSATATNDPSKPVELLLG